MARAGRLRCDLARHEPDPSRQQAHSDAARRTLIDATIRVLADEGYRAATAVRIQEVSGLSRGLVGYHFGSKQRLMEEVIESIRTSYRDQTSHGRDPSLCGLDQIIEYFSIYLTRLERDPRRAKAMLVLAMESVAEASDVRRAMRAHLASAREDIRECLQAGLDDGSVRSTTDPVVHATLLHGALRGVVLQYVLDPKAIDLRRVREAMLGSMRHELAAEAPPARRRGAARQA